MLKVEQIPVESLVKYERNARKHEDKDIEAIMASIREFDFNDPLGIWKDNIIVEGHGRLEAARRLGMKEVPCIRLDHLTDEQRRAYALAHNKTAELSGWDFNLLDSELTDISDIDMSQFGFNMDDLDFGSTDDHLKEQKEPEAKEGKMCACPACGFEFEIL